MEETKKIFKFEGEQGEDFHIWSARTEAALEAKDVLSPVLTDMVDAEDLTSVSQADRLSIAKAKATIIQGLGNKPLRLVLPVKDNPFKMWKALKERYAVSNLVTKVQLHTKLARMEYKGQTMSEYVAGFEDIFNQLSAMGTELTQDMKIATFLASFGDKSRSSFGHVVTVLQSKDTTVSWELVSSTLLQEYEEQMWASTAKDVTGKRPIDSTVALTASGQKPFRGKYNSFPRQAFKGKDRRKCWECGKTGHFARDHKNGKRSANTQESVFEGHANHATMLMAVRKHKDGAIQLLVDSGASDHMVNCADWLSDMKAISEKMIILGNGDCVRATHCGTMVFDVSVGSGSTVTRTVELRNVLFVPELKANLISCSALCRDGYTMTFNRSACVVWNQDCIEMQGVRSGGLYIVSAAPKKPSIKVAMVANKMKELWHHRLGHAYIPSIEQLAKKGAVTGLDLSSNIKKPNDCAGCLEGKQHKLVLRRKEFRSQSRGEVIHSDVSGRMAVKSLGGAEYYVTFIDEYSGYITVFPISRKSDVLDKLRLFRPWFERKYDCKIKTLQCDGGGEYIGCDGYLREHGIERPENPSYCPEVNGMAERANRSLMESARAMLRHSGLPKPFWAEAVVAAADIRNRFLCPRNDSTTSYEMLTGKKPRVDHIRVFGSRAWVHVPKNKRTKLDSKSKEGIIVACMENSQYKVWLRDTKAPVMARHLRIIENDFPEKSWFMSASTELVDDADLTEECTPPGEICSNQDQIDTSTVSSRPLTHNTSVTPAPAQETLTYTPAVPSTHRTEWEDTNEALHSSQGHDDGSLVETSGMGMGRYPTRNRAHPNVYTPGNAFLSTVDCEPISVEEAMQMADSEKWKEAIKDELESLDKHDTWELVYVPDRQKILSSRFVFKRKMNKDGTVERYKARLVVKGFMQGLVDNTYAPVVDFTTVRVALSVAIQRGYTVHQMDVRTAFLHGNIDEDVFIHPPVGSEIRLEPGQALKLKKGLYGLKQAPKLWYTKWKEVMEKLGMTALITDKCVFRKKELWILLYVDDVVIIGKNCEDIGNVKRQLSSLLEMKDMGNLSTFLGVSFSRDSDGGLLSQAHYVKLLLSRFGMQDCKPVSTPAVKEGISEGNKRLANQRQYQELVGSLLFLSSRTRPDIALAVNKLSRHCSRPTEEHMQAGKRVLRYLKGTENFCLRIGKIGLTLAAYSDADWGGDCTDRKSTSGSLLLLGGTAVYWKSRKQKSMALSTTEAEFFSASEACKMVVWMRSLLNEFDVIMTDPTVLFVDNQGAIAWGKEGVRHAKHVEIRRNYVLELIQEKKILLRYCDTHQMAADMFTKPLLKTTFDENRALVGMKEKQFEQEGEL